MAPQIWPSALRSGVCVFCFYWLFTKCHHNTMQPTAKKMKDRQQRLLLPTWTLADLLGDQEPFALHAGEKGHTPPAEQPAALQTLIPASIVMHWFPFYIAAPHSLSSSRRPGRQGWLNSGCFCAIHWPPPCRMPTGMAEGEAKPGTGAGGGEEGWEVFSPRSTTEANTLCNLILQGWGSSGFLKKSPSVAKICF